MAGALALCLVAGLAGAASPAGAAPRKADPAPVPDPTALVNPLIGTLEGDGADEFGGAGANTFPGATMPFGMTQFSPDTVDQLWGGYWYRDNRIRGFSLTHLSGPGCGTYQDVPIMPFVGDVTASPATNPDKYVSTFSHRNEEAAPGYYKVGLDNGVTTELTATTRTAMARLSYPPSAKSTLLVDVSGSIMGVQDAQLTIGRDTISGYAVSGAFCGGTNRYKLNFTMKFSRPFASLGTWRNDVVTPGLASQRKITSKAKLPATAGAAKTLAALRARTIRQPAGGKAAKARDTTVSGPGSGGYVQFDTRRDAKVEVRIGISFTSLENAGKNLAAESGSTPFDTLRARAWAAWRERLSRIQVAGGTRDQQTIFYTALYHALVAPNTYSDANGQYVGFDGRLHTVGKGHAAYSNFSGWDVYRSQVQLLALLEPRVASDIARSMTDFAEQGGAWDRWTVANDFTGVMNGDPYHAIVSTMYAFGAREFDAKKALKLMVKGATVPTRGYVERPGLQKYLELGYVPDMEPGVWGPTATTLEYTTADFTIAQLAQRLGDTANHAEFMRRAQFWQNLYNPSTKYIQPRNRDGSFKAGFNPSSMDSYVEGSGAQYHWMVPYNVRGLFAAMGGNEAAKARLDTFFTELSAGGSTPYSNLGNEPSMEVPWQYVWAGAPHRTQDVVRKVVNQLYKAAPDGLVGNDDLGALSSWYVWAAMGMYPEMPGRAEMVLASPLFPKITVNRPGGKRITITADNASAGTYYVHGLAVNGKASTRAWLPESFITGGGTLDFALDDAPNTSWGSRPVDEPPSFREGEAPVRPFAEPARVVVEPGSSGTAKLGALSIGEKTAVSYTATPPAGIAVTPASGSFEVPSGGTATTEIAIGVGAGVAQGYYSVPITFRTAAGSPLPPATLLVVAARPDSMFAAFNNAGISSDSARTAANIDGFGFSYSAEALAAAGVRRGAPVNAGGFTFSWPDVAPGQFDNAIVAGQTIGLPAGGSTRLAFLGCATNGKGTGTVTITYTDGTTQSAPIGFNDWTLGGGSQPIDFGNVIAAKTPYRNTGDGTSQQVGTHVFATAPIPLQAGKQIASVRLPATSTGGTLHVFAVAVA